MRDRCGIVTGGHMGLIWDKKSLTWDIDGIISWAPHRPQMVPTKKWVFIGQLLWDIHGPTHVDHINKIVLLKKNIQHKSSGLLQAY